MTIIVWFRKDLRLADNPALTHAATLGEILPVYIIEDDHPRSPGGASHWWLEHSLKALKKELAGLLVFRGNPETILEALANSVDARAVFWNRRYDPHGVERDKTVKKHLCRLGLEVRSFNGSLLNEPWEVSTASGTPFKVFSPYWRAAIARPVSSPINSPNFQSVLPADGIANLKPCCLTQAEPNWTINWKQYWQPGERGAQIRLKAFLEADLKEYGKLRDRPDRLATSRLSPHLHFGELSPRQIYDAVQRKLERDVDVSKDASKFMSEIGWREFSYQLLFNFPDLTIKNWRTNFDGFAWRDAPNDLRCWQRGLTGYPLVDAGMRELWKTGFVHNRARMVAASFLVKHLRIHWREGEAWFWDTLVDADAANNAAGWQWVAGSGADAAPYFRIFNPVTQGRKFDPNGDYIRRWCPELSSLNTKWIHAPWEAPENVLREAGVKLSANYPGPIVDHAKARALALDAYRAITAS